MKGIKLIVSKYGSGKEKDIKQINDIWEWPKNGETSTEKGNVWIKASKHWLNVIYVTTCKKAVETFQVSLLKSIV